MHGPVGNVNKQQLMGDSHQLDLCLHPEDCILVDDAATVIPLVIYYQLFGRLKYQPLAGLAAGFACFFLLHLTTLNTFEFF